MTVKRRRRTKKSKADFFQEARGEVLLHDRTTRSYNDNNVHKAELPLFDYNMNKDRDEAAMPDQYPDEKPDKQEGEDFQGQPTS